MVTSIGMLHIGVVFVVFGIFLIGAGILPDDITQWDIFGMCTHSKHTRPTVFGGIFAETLRSCPPLKYAAKSTWWNELVCTGLFALGLGIFLVVLNCLISKREEDDLEEYVQRALTRTRSGHRLERDVETGGLTTRQNRRSKSQHQMDDGSAGGVDNPAGGSGGSPSDVVTPDTSEMMTPTTPHGNFSGGSEIRQHSAVVVRHILSLSLLSRLARCWGQT